MSHRLQGCGDRLRQGLFPVPSLGVFRGARDASQFCEGFRRDCAPEGLSAAVRMMVAAAAYPPRGKDNKKWGLW